MDSERRLNQEKIIAESVRLKLIGFSRHNYSQYSIFQSDLNARISEKYPKEEERIKYVLYHELNGSSYKDGSCPNFDFPGDCSIQAAVDKL